MQLVGQTICHSTFGNGVVTGCGGDILTICFPAGEKKFIYPDAFAGHLTLENSAMQRKIQGVLTAREEAKTARRQAAQAKQERRRRLCTLRITPHAQAVFDVRPEQRDALFSAWSVSTGTYVSGCSRGQPRIPDRLKPNSLCLLTGRADGAPEGERRILGAFMVEEDFFGSDCRDGIVKAHPVYRLELPRESCLRFWPYITREPSEQRWGRTALKYCANSTVERVLFDMKTMFLGTEKEEAAERFYQYYCLLNRLQARQTPELPGI
jgi:hypothetical protein